MDNNFIQLIQNLEIKITANDHPSKKGKPVFIDELNSWGYSPNTEYWGFRLEINGYILENCQDNFKEIRYDDYLLRLFQDFITQQVDLSSAGRISKKKYLPLLRSLYDNFITGVRFDDVEDYYPNEITSHPMSNTILSDSIKISINSFFLKYCISVVMQQHKNVLKSTIDYLEQLNMDTFVANDQLHTREVPEKLLWTRTDIDLLELIVSLYQSGAIQNTTKNLNQKDAISYISNLFGKDGIKDGYSKLSKARGRKKDEKGNFLDRLSKELSIYNRKQEEKNLN